MSQLKMLPDKALVYATNKRGLLIFKEPDFPDVPPQVPGGTIDENEKPLMAAKREFAEETGLSEQIKLTFLCLDKHHFEHNGQKCAVNRYYFHAAISDEIPATWDYYEHFAHDGADPILFRFSWISLSRAKCTLDLGTGAAIDILHKQLSENP